MIEDSEQLTRLIKSFRRAEERVMNVLNDRTSNTVQKLRINFDRELKKVDLSLTQQTKSWANRDLEVAYNEGAKKIGSLPRGQPETKFSKEVVLNPYIEISSKVSKATNDTRRAINKIIDDSAKDGITSVYNVKQAIQKEMFKQNGSLMVEYSNGAKVQLSAYASMCARTERIVSVNTGSFNRCKDLGIDLVRCTKVPNCCPYCRKYEDKVYSISGRDKRFPALYGGDGPLKHGYNIMHPNCRHEFLPFVENLYTEDEVKDLQKQSNVFTNYSKDDKIFKEYNRTQNTLRQWRSELNEYNNLKSTYGKAFPYSTLGAFRRGRRANSETYRRLRGEKLYEEGQFLTQNGKSYTKNLINVKNLNQVLDKETVTDIQKILDDSEENARRTWNSYAQYLNIGSTNYTGGAHFSQADGRVYVNFLQTASDKQRGAYTTFFHETGHAIDYYSGITKRFEPYISQSYQSKKHFVNMDEKNKQGYTLGGMIKAEVSDYIKQRTEELKLKAVEDGGKKSDITQSSVYLDIEKSFRTLGSEYTHAISDIFEGATKGKISFGSGHMQENPKYWDDGKKLSLEAFAHFYSAVTKNKKSLSVLKTTLPKSYEIFEELLEEIRNG